MADGSGLVPSDEGARLRRGSDHRAGRPHRVHQHARRRHGDLHNERRRFGRAAAHERPGPDGGPFFSFDGKQIVFRGRELGAGAERDDYLALLKDALWRPTQLEIFVMDRDGRNVRQVTRLGGANFAPSWHPDGRRIIFSSNHHNPKGRNFDLFLINLDGTGLEQVTFNPTFDGFPMFSPDGRRLAFSSNRARRRKEKRTSSWRTGTTASS